MMHKDSDSPRSCTSPTYGDPEMGGSPKRKRAESHAALRGRKAHASQSLAGGVHDIQGLDIMVAPIAISANTEKLQKNKNNLQNTPVVVRGGVDLYLGSSQGCTPSLHDAAGTPGDHSGFTDGQSAGMSSYSASPQFLEALHPPAAAALTLLTGANSASKRASTRHQVGKNTASTVAPVATRNAALRSGKAASVRDKGVTESLQNRDQRNTSAHPEDSTVSSEGDGNSFLHRAPRGAHGAALQTRNDIDNMNNYSLTLSLETTGEDQSGGADESDSDYRDSSGLFDGDSMGHSLHGIGIAFGASPPPQQQQQEQQQQIPYAYLSGPGRGAGRDRGSPSEHEQRRAARSLSASLNSSVAYGMPVLALDSPMMMPRTHGGHTSSAPHGQSKYCSSGGARGGMAESKPFPVDRFSVDTGMDSSALSSISPVVSTSPSSFLRDVEDVAVDIDIADDPESASASFTHRAVADGHSHRSVIGIARSSLRSSREAAEVNNDVDRLTGHAAASPTISAKFYNDKTSVDSANRAGSEQHKDIAHAHVFNLNSSNDQEISERNSSSGASAITAQNRMIVNGLYGLYGGAELNIRERSDSTTMPPTLFSGEPSSSALRRITSQDADSDMEEELADPWGIMGEDVPIVRGSRLRFTPLGMLELTGGNNGGTLSPYSPEMCALGAQMSHGFATAEQSPPLPLGGDNSGMAGRLSSLSVGHGDAGQVGLSPYGDEEDTGLYLRSRSRGSKLSPVLPFGSRSFRDALSTASTGSLDEEEEKPAELDPRTPGSAHATRQWQTLSLRAATATRSGGGSGSGRSSFYTDTPHGSNAIGSPIGHLADAGEEEEEEEEEGRGLGFRLLAAAGGGGGSTGTGESAPAPSRRKSNPSVPGGICATWRMQDGANGTLSARASGRRAFSASFNDSNVCPSPSQGNGNILNMSSNSSLNLSRSSNSSSAAGGGPGGPGGRPLPDQSAFDRSTGAAKYEQSASPMCPATPMRTPTWSHDSERKNLERMAMGSSEDYSGLLMPALLRQNSLQSSKLLLSVSGEGMMGTNDDAAQAVDFRRDFVDEGLLGSGTFADVYRVRARATDEIFAVKKSKRQFRSRKDREWLLHEVKSMQRVSSEPSEYVVHLVRAWQENGYFYVQVELAERGTLKDLLTDLTLRGQSVPHNTIWHILYDVCQGLHHVHKAGMVHLDVKPANLLVTHAGLVKIGDFGMAAVIGQGEDGREGDTRYMAPELLESSDRQPPADMFSLGLTLYELCLPPAPLVQSTHDSHNGLNMNKFGMQNAPNPLIQIGSGLPFEGPMWHVLREGKAEPLLGRPPALQAAIARAMVPCPSDRALPLELAMLPEAAATKTDVDVTLSTARPRIISTAANLSPRSTSNLVSQRSDSAIELAKSGQTESSVGSNSSSSISISISNGSSSSSSKIGHSLGVAGGGDRSIQLSIPSRVGSGSMPPLQIPGGSGHWNDFNLGPCNLHIPSVASSSNSNTEYGRVTTPTGELHGTQFWRVQPLSAQVSVSVSVPGPGAQVAPLATGNAPLVNSNDPRQSPLHNRLNFRSVTKQEQADGSAPD